VRATIIEPEAEPAPAAAPRPDAPKHALAKRTPGRLRAGIALIGMGLKTLLTGTPEERAKHKRS
ncbi:MULTISPECIES: hypothetical protein, partial [Enorma]